mgnify:FL=1|jgi:UDP-glucuronate 4-epimerase
MKILITGGAGFIGSHVVEKLHDHQVLIVDSLDPYYDPKWKKERLNKLLKLPHVQWRHVDILTFSELEKVFHFFQPDRVIHLAAMPGVQPSLVHPAKYVDVDVKGTVHVLSLAAQFGVSRFVFASSSSVYGPAVNRPCREDDELQPVSPYAAAKAAAEMYCRTYQRLYHLPVTIVRPFTVYGPEQRPDMALWKFVMKMMNGEPITLYRGAMGRDYTYVSDIADGIVRACFRPQAVNRTYNLGNGCVVPLEKLVAELEKAIGKRAVIEWRDLPAGDVPLTWADTTRAEQELEFRAQVSLSEGIRLFADWFWEEGVKR